jgi:hypothetical protein
MRILFDQGTPVPLKQRFPDHQVHTAFELGWSRLTNGEFLAAAEKQFDVLVTTDQNLRYQQSFAVVGCASRTRGRARISCSPGATPTIGELRANHARVGFPQDGQTVHFRRTPRSRPKSCGACLMRTFQKVSGRTWSTRSGCLPHLRTPEAGTRPRVAAIRRFAKRFCPPTN